MGSTLDAEAPDGLHFFHDINALIQLEPGGEHLDLPPRALSIASVRSTALFTLLNVSTGDSGGTRRAGVRLGWTTHLYTIRRFEKLTGRDGVPGRRRDNTRVARSEGRSNGRAE